MYIKAMTRILLSAISMCLWTSVAQAAAVWEVTSPKGNVLYLAGTLHLLSEQDYPLDAAYQYAYAQSQRLVFETDQQALTSPSFQQAMADGFSLQDGQQLSDLLRPATYAALQAVLKEKGLPPDAFKSAKPALVALTLTMQELQRLGLTEAGVDNHFFLRAQADNKPVSELETPEQQLAFVVNMGSENPDQFIQFTLNEIDEMSDSLALLRAAWQNGDLQQLERLGIAPMQGHYPQVYDTLIKKRNTEWMRQLLVLFDTPHTYFVLVGALHLPGEDGLIPQFQQRGFKVKAL
ncbi:TraB/GumN family protein [Lacimicrobium sp. SS2-24]|uniref:TraB/GumN family protein n=1 Tax=Lacimicrobium sp. SS2-24 TaxID=2005569 RepID=UPI001438C456|nr:TraB/GumN family protein [Lacimicrobium sp. SS2-24]